VKIIPFLLLIFGVLPSTCGADDGYFGGRGSIVFPSTDTDIRMVSETVNLKLKREYFDKTTYRYDVSSDCQFTFVNPGKDAVITMGFPAEIDEQEAGRDLANQEPTPEAKVDTVLAQNFKTYVDGASVENQIQDVENLENIEGLNFHHAFLWPVKLPHNQPIHLHNTYNFGTGGQFDSNSVSYILKTGALWAGKMDKAEITIDLGENVPGYLLDVKPAGYTYQKGVIHWLFTDFKPAEDISVVIRNKTYIDNILTGYGNNAWNWRQYAEQKQELRLFINEIYASHGKIFMSKDLKDYFSKQWWYHPDPNFSPKMLTPEENEYIEKILKIEKGTKVSNL